MNIYDITLPISEDMPVWPGDPKVSINKKLSIISGDPCNLSRIDMGSHTGTHIDAPYHFEDNGLRIDQIPMEILIGNARVFNIPAINEISLNEVKALDLLNVKRILFKTSNSEVWKSNINIFLKEFVAITNEAAEYLVKAGIKLVGIDYLSIEKFGSKTHETHHTLLRNGIIILEGLNLSDITPGDYELIALPLRIKDGDGSPARVILRGL